MMQQWTSIVLDQIRKAIILQIILVYLTRGQPPIGINWNLLTQSLQQQQQQKQPNYDGSISSPANWVFV